MKKYSVPLLFTLLLASAPAFAQTPVPVPAPAPPATAPAPKPPAADPFVKGTAEATPAPAGAALPAQGLLRFEYFSLPHTVARKTFRQFPKQEDLYAWLDAELENEKSEVKLERLILLTVRGGQRSKVEEIDEYPYATEFNSPQISQNVSLAAPAGPAPAPAPAPVDPAAPAATPFAYAPATPTTFTFRNTGWTIEAEITIGEDGKTVDLNLAPEFIKLLKLAPQTSSKEIVQPQFETNKLTTQVLTVMGKPTLVGSMSPPVATGITGGNEANRTWLLYVTITNPR